MQVMWFMNVFPASCVYGFHYSSSMLGAPAKSVHRQRAATEPGGIHEPTTTRLERGQSDREALAGRSPGGGGEADLPGVRPGGCPPAGAPQGESSPPAERRGGAPAGSVASTTTA